MLSNSPMGRRRTTMETATMTTTEIMIKGGFTEWNSIDHGHNVIGYKNGTYAEWFDLGHTYIYVPRPIPSEDVTLEERKRQWLDFWDFVDECKKNEEYHEVFKAEEGTYEYNNSKIAICSHGTLFVVERKFIDVKALEEAGFKHKHMFVPLSNGECWAEDIGEPTYRLIS